MKDKESLVSILDDVADDLKSISSKLSKEDRQLLPDGLDSRHEFTKLHINSGNSSFDITVVGSPDIVEQKLAAKTNSLLKG